LRLTLTIVLWNFRAMPVAPTVIKKALSSLQLHEVLLFGSHAKGNANEDSDLDLIVVVPTNHPRMNFSERVHWIRQIRCALEIEGIRMSMDVLVYSPEQWQQFGKDDSGFARELRRSALRIA
jgi:predicted nucleotidyltransferase